MSIEKEPQTNLDKEDFDEESFDEESFNKNIEAIESYLSNDFRLFIQQDFKDLHNTSDLDKLDESVDLLFNTIKNKNLTKEQFHSCLYYLTELLQNTCNLYDQLKPKEIDIIEKIIYNSSVVFETVKNKIINEENKIDEYSSYFDFIFQLYDAGKYTNLIDKVELNETQEFIDIQASKFVNNFFNNGNINDFEPEEFISLPSLDQLSISTILSGFVTHSNSYIKNEIKVFVNNVINYYIESKSGNKRDIFLSFYGSGFFKYHSEVAKGEGYGFFEQFSKRFGVNKYEEVFKYSMPKKEEDLSNYYSRILDLERGNPGCVKSLSNDDGYGISNFHRYPVFVLQKMYEIEDKNLPYVVAFFPESDHNGAFTNPQLLASFYQDLEKLGYKLLIVECRSTKDFIKRSKYLYDRFGLAQGAMISGHGNPESLEIGKDIKLDIQTVFEGLHGRFARMYHNTFLAEGATVIFNSCSFGAPGGLAEKISKIYGFKVCASLRDKAIKEINIVKNPDGDLGFRVIYYDN